MSSSRYFRPRSVDEAVALAGPDTRFIAGGTNLMDLMQEKVVRPPRLIDISGLPLRDLRDTADGGLHIGALSSNTVLAWSRPVEQRYPLLSMAIRAGALPHTRNKATVGGNLLQRTRCYYFYDVETSCNKREPGTGCSARLGVNRIHAILGASRHCVAVHPSDMCVALAALDAEVVVQGPKGQRRIPFAEFHRLPGEHPERDNTLADDELILAIELPPSNAHAHSAYLKIRDRTSQAFALVSVAAALQLDEGERIGEVRLALGGVAHKPWRLPEVEAWMCGQPATIETFDAAAERMLAGAQPLIHNAYKIPMARQAIVRALEKAVRGTEMPGR